MASPQSFAATILLAALVAGLMWVNIKRDGRRLLQRDFPAPIEPPQSATPCNVRFPLDEAPSACILCATPAGLYMATPAASVVKRSWTSQYHYLKQPVLIPWSRLKYGPAKFPAIGWFRFDVTGTKIVFFVRRAVALSVLAQRIS